MEEIKKVTSRFFYRLISLLSGANFFSKLKKIQEFEHKSREEIETYQFSQLKDLILIAYERVPFYRRKYEKEGLDSSSLRNLSDLSKFPVVSKREIRYQYKSMISSECDINKLKHTQSSGSTGEPKIFYYNAESYGWRLASQFFGWQKSGFKFGQKWLRISMAERKNLFYKVFNFFSRCIYISLTDFNEEKYEKIRLVLEKEKPPVIYSYCSALYVLSEYLDVKGIHYDFVESIIVQGDMCFPQYRETIERVFQTKVFDTYGGDGVIISGQCQEGNYHIQDIGVIVEVVGEDYKPLVKGELGKILVTDLHNKVMPLIRYEIADLGVKKGVGCSCGSKFSLMGRPVGRDTDIIKLSNGMSLLVEYFVVVFEHYLEILQFQVREVGQNKLLIYLEVSETFTEEIQEKVVKEIVDYCKGGVEIDVEIVEEIPLQQSNKRRLVIGKDKK